MVCMTTVKKILPVSKNSCEVTVYREFYGNEKTFNFPMSDLEFKARYEKWRRGTLIQDAFPNTSPSLREGLLTGMTEEEWNQMKEEEE